MSKEDDPYELGMLEEIAGVNFGGGGNWLALYSLPASGGASVNLSFEFPDIIKGTPGLPWCVNTFAPSYFVAVPRTITPATLKEKHKSATTRVYTTFGAKFRPFGVAADEVLTFIRLDGSLATGAHRLRVRLNVANGRGSSQPFQVALFSAATIKPGYKIPIRPFGSATSAMAPEVLPGVRSLISFGYRTSEVDDFIVNSKALTVTF